MPIRTSYKHGTPSWTDLATSDMEAAQKFYGELFGWTARGIHYAPPPGATQEFSSKFFGWTGEPATEPEAMGYMVFVKGEHAVAGCAPTGGDEMPTCWSTYVTVENADETIAKAREAGGNILLEACDVLSAGRMGVITDPTGATFSIWQPKEHIGATVVNEHGALCWNELATRDTETAKEFYKKIFGWGALQVGDPNAPPFDYHGWTTAGSSDFADIVGGMIKMDENWPAEVPAHWMTYFAVDDCDGSAAKVTELGGKVCVPPTDIPPGRFAVVEDPQGATFTIIRMNPQPDRSAEAAEGVSARSGA